MSNILKYFLKRGSSRLVADTSAGAIVGTSCCLGSASGTEAVGAEETAVVGAAIELDGVEGAGSEAL